MSTTQTSQGYQQPILPVADLEAFSAVRDAIDACFSAPKLAGFLKSLQRARIRVRDFEVVLGKGLLGSDVQRSYTRLGNGDQGQIREFYLAALEHVAPELRQKFFKLYAYY